MERLKCYIPIVIITPLLVLPVWNILRSSGPGPFSIVTGVASLFAIIYICSKIVGIHKKNKNDIARSGILISVVIASAVFALKHVESENNKHNSPSRRYLRLQQAMQSIEQSVSIVNNIYFIARVISSVPEYITIVDDSVKKSSIKPVTKEIPEIKKYPEPQFYVRDANGNLEPRYYNIKLHGKIRSLQKENKQKI